MAALARAWQKPRGFALDVVPALLYVALLFWAGLIPMSHLPGPDFELVDKVWHLLAFGGLAGLGSRSLRHFGRSESGAPREAALIAVTLGALLEVAQSFTAYRSAELADLIADAIGAGLAYLVLRQMARVANSSSARPAA